jgi:site-specific DNA recombinase
VSFPPHLLDELARAFARAAIIDDQLRNCRRRANDEGWAIIHEYADRAITGADRSRPQYQEMLSAAKRKEFDILLVDDLSRLARDQVESERVIRYLEFRSIRIVATADGYDSQTKTATAYRRPAQHGSEKYVVVAVG